MSFLSGRTSLTTVNTGDIADDAVTLAKLAAGTANYTILYDGSGNPAEAASISVAQGGTGAATHTANNVLVGNGTSAISSVAPSTSGNILTSNGSAWTSAAAGGGEFSGSFVSSQQTVSTAGALTLAHGLGALPILVQFSGVCQTAEGGYSIGDTLIFNNQTGGQGNAGISCVVDTTNLNIKFGEALTAIVIINKTNGTTFGATNGNWKLIARAWK